MESRPPEGQDQYIEMVKSSVAKHLAAERQALTSLISQRLTEIHESLLNQMEKDLRKTVPSTQLPDSGSAGTKVDADNILTKGTEDDDSLAIKVDSPENSGFQLNQPEKVTQRHRPTNMLTRLVAHPAFEGFFYWSNIDQHFGRSTSYPI